MRILDVVRDGLGRYVLAKYKQAYGEEYLLRLVADVGRLNEEHLDTEIKVLSAFDAQRWLKAMTKYKNLFFDELGPGASRGQADFNRANAISIAYELLDARNVWAHANASDQFDDDGVYRVAENATRLLLAVGATKESKDAKTILREVGRRIYGNGGGDGGPQLALVQQQLASAKQELSSSNKELTSVRKELTSIKRKYSTASNEQASKQRELTTNKRKLTAARKDVKAATTELASTQKQLETAEQNLRAKTQELTVTKRRLAATITELEAYKSTSRATMSPERTSSAQGHSKLGTPAAAGRRSGVTAKEMKLNGQNLRGKDFSGHDLSNADLENADLSGARLRDAKLSTANLANANLSEADMTDANMRGANLTAANLHNATLKNADLTGAVLVRARLQGALDTSTILPDGSRWKPSRAMNDFLRG